MTVKSSISLTDEQHAFARELVSAGRYPSVSAVVAQGIELLRARAEAESMEIEALELVLEERRRAAFVSSEEMGKRLTAMVERKRRDPAYTVEFAAEAERDFEDLQCVELKGAALVFGRDSCAAD